MLKISISLDLDIGPRPAQEKLISQPHPNQRPLQGVEHAHPTLLA
jgi:hypothetical protein